MSPNYPNDYPNSVTCVWALKPGQAFQLEFEKFYTESGYDLLQGYSSLSSFTSKYTGHRRKGGREGGSSLPEIPNPSTHGQRESLSCL